MSMVCRKRHGQNPKKAIVALEDYWSVGFYAPSGAWEEITTFDHLYEAAEVVSFLNGGPDPSVSWS